MKGKEVEKVEDLVLYIHKFLRLFLDKNVVYYDRDEIHRLLYKVDNKNFYKPIKEHGITDFYHNGSALCSEYSVMGCNLLSIFGINAMIIMDKEHVFNILVNDNGEGFVLDFSSFVIVKDLKGRNISHIPFYEEIEGFNEELAKKIVNSKYRMEYEDYYYVYINESLFKQPTGLIRSYGIDNDNVKSKSLII